METGSTAHPRTAAQNESERGQPTSDDVEYVGMRVDGTPLVLKLTDHKRLTPDRSLELVRHSPAGFDWGYTGSRPAQLACALLLDYYDDETIALQCYIQFRDAVVSQLVCDGPADCWHLTGDDIEAVLAEFQNQHALTADGGDPSPSLPANWSGIIRPCHHLCHANASSRSLQASSRRVTIYRDERNKFATIECRMGIVLPA